MDFDSAVLSGILQLFCMEAYCMQQTSAVRRHGMDVS